MRPGCPELPILLTGPADAARDDPADLLVKAYTDQELRGRLGTLLAERRGQAVEGSGTAR